MKQMPLDGGPRGEGDPARTTLEGVLERITYVNEQDGWSVVRLQVAGRPDRVTVVGNLPGIQPGESLRVNGSWVQDRRFGEQFRADSCVAVQPSTLVGMKRYLGSGLVQGIGKVMADRLVDHFGLDTFEVIENQAQRITEVEGIGPKRKVQIIEAWAEQRAIKDVMLFLQSHDVSPAFAAKIYRQYGDRAVAVVQDNPYRLAVDIFGIGFKTADAIALAQGLSRTSPLRAGAGVLHVLGQLCDEGHVFCPLEQLVAAAVEVLEIPEPVIRQALAGLLEQQLVVQQGEGAVEAVYLRAMHTAEQGSALLLRAVLEAPAREVDLHAERAVAWFEAEAGISLARQQALAVRRATEAKVLVITGGPGTGKTTIVNAIISILQRKGLRAQLCAPTGRAAKRLAETTGQEARTIHRMLEYDPREQRFGRDADNPLAADLLVVDEVSMVDMVLLHGLLQAVPPACRLVLVGDVDQLPSVGPGSVLRELIRCGTVEVVQLTEIFRQAQQSLIVVNAHRVNQGEPLQAGERETADFFFIERQDPEVILATVLEIVGRRIPARFNVDPVEQIQVLTPMHRGELGSVRLNAELQALLNPDAQSVARGGRIYRVGDKVMQLRNNYDLDVFNGDIGRVVTLDEEQRQAQVRFDERVVTYDFTDLDELVLGYACTIHKSQGSEYPVVVIPLHTQHYAMLQRNLLYTALTRGQRLVVLVGSSKAVGIAVRNHRVDQRHTWLARRLAVDPPVDL